MTSRDSLTWGDLRPAPSVGRPSLTWALPGHGEALPSCGRFVHFGHETSGGEVHYRTAAADCRRFECPVCHGWAFREAERITWRIEAAGSLGRTGRRGWKPAHFVVSPPPEEAVRAIETQDGYRALRKRAYQVAHERGVRGGAVVFHPVRLDSRRWGGGGCPHAGPHFHVLGDGWLDREAVLRGHARDGWVVKGLGVRSSVRDTALYLLSHAGRADPPTSGNPALEQPTRQRSPFEAVTWFGSLSYNRLRVGRTPETGAFCAVCRELVPLREWFELSWCGSGPPPEGSGVADRAAWRAEAIDRTDRLRVERVRLW